MLSEQVHTFEQQDVGMLIYSGTPYFRASDVTCLLGYKNSAKTIRAHVQDEHTTTLQQLTQSIPDFVMKCSDAAGKSPLYVSFAGLLEFLQNIKCVKAETFKEWLLAYLVPELIRTCSVNDAVMSQHYQAQLMSHINSFAYSPMTEDEPVSYTHLTLPTNREV